jgi:hypothetical protein
MNSFIICNSRHILLWGLYEGVGDGRGWDRRECKNCLSLENVKERDHLEWRIINCSFIKEIESGVVDRTNLTHNRGT